MVNDSATSLLQDPINHVRLIDGQWNRCRRSGRPCTKRSGRTMKHEAILAGDWLPREPRVEAEFGVRVHCEAGEIEAQIVNLSSDGFRLHSENPLEVGWEVTLEAAKHFPVKALICWACGQEAGGVFAEPVAL